MTEYTIYPYHDGGACFSVGPFTYDKSPFPKVHYEYSSWEDWYENNDAEYRYEWLTIGRGDAHTSDYHIFAPLRMYFGFQIYGERTTWGALREPVHLWLTYSGGMNLEERESVGDVMQLFYCPWGQGFDFDHRPPAQDTWDFVANHLTAPATKPFAYMGKTRAAFESVALRLINTHHVIEGGPTWLVALASLEREKPPMAYAPLVLCGAHDDGDPPACRFGYPDDEHYILQQRFLMQQDGYGRETWPRIVVGGQGSERVVTPLIPGPAQARGGKRGAAHRTRL
jgi:hypothetical protein